MNADSPLDCGSGCRGFDPRHSPEIKRETPGEDSPLVPPGAPSPTGYSPDSVQRASEDKRELAQLQEQIRVAREAARYPYFQTRPEVQKPTLPELPDPLPTGRALIDLVASRLVSRRRWSQQPSRPSVYFVVCQPFVKIGYSADISGRLRSLRTFNPHPLSLEALVDGSVLLEKALHSHFKKQRGHGEWFRLAGPIAQFLSSKPVVDMAAAIVGGR